MSSVIKVENLSKQYRLGDVGTGTLSHDLKRWWYLTRGKEDPYLQIGEINDRSAKGNSDYVWALKDINFDVKAGEVLGIIGRNGAGKSTLLKILSKTTTPTTGSVKVKGRIASLLEVGTGFHPELSGRENIYLNGAILGMTKREIQSKFDEIVDFSGVERYIDTPVKRYSSGMYVRLAFAVAAHLEPEILIVDEVLAVGDAEFQKKCLGKMKDVSVNDGRTVLFVSHNMGAVKDLCTRSILLKNGLVHSIGETNAIVKQYLLNQVVVNSASDLVKDLTSRRGFGEVRFTKIVINNGEAILDPEKDIFIEATAVVNQPINRLYFSLMVRGPENSEPITTTGMILVTDKTLDIGKLVEFNVTIPANTFRTGLFPAYFWLGKKAELAEDNYPYDLLDSVYYLNISSDKSKEDLGYSSIQPGGYFNIESEIFNIQILYLIIIYSILITGGTGSLGKALTKHIFQFYPKVKRVVIFSRDEQKQFEMAQAYPQDKYPQIRFFIGDVRDFNRLKTALKGVDYVIHAAAMKHVPIAEYNPMECVKTNILGAENVINACLETNVERVISLSTDKAAAPVNLYGATKLASDKLFVAANNIRGSNPIRFSVVRYGNVMGSNGSVIPFFLKKRKEGVLPITDPNMTRFNISLEEGVSMVMHALEHAMGGEIFVPKIPSYKITDVAEAIGPECKKVIIGIRPGEKIHEEMITASDSFYTYDLGKYFVILPSTHTWQIDEFIKEFNAVKVPYGFNYHSGDNSEWESIESLRTKIKAINE